MENGELHTIAGLFLKSAVKRFAEYKESGDKTIAQLSEKQVYKPQYAIRM